MARTATSILLWLIFVSGIAQIAHHEIYTPQTTRASDALPLYLSGCAVADGMDPTQQDSLAKAYHSRDLSVGAATFSTLYPATAGWLFQPVARLSWEQFTVFWRSLLLASLASIPLSVLFLHRQDRGYGWWMAGLLGALLSWHPYAAECIRLGQVNLLLAALCAQAIALVWAGPTWASGGFLALGALIKLVPAGLGLPLLAARRFGALGLATGVGVLGLIGTFRAVPLSQVIQGIRETLAFQSSIDPDWLVGTSPAPDMVRWFGYFRHEPMQWLTLGAAAVMIGLRPSQKTAAWGMGLICAWLGADAAGFHVLYTPLLYPTFVLFTVMGGLQLGVLFAIYYGLAWADVLSPEPRMVLFGVLVWGWALVQLFQEARGVARSALEGVGELVQAGSALAGLGVGATLGLTWPGEGPVAAPLPEGQTIPDGAGFIRPGDEVPGQVRALGAGLDRPASTLAKPGTIRHLQLYMKKSPLLWRNLATQYPARESLFLGRAEAAPSGELRDVSGSDVREWLLEEKRVVSQLKREGIIVEELESALDLALQSGLADEEVSIPSVPNE